VFETTAKIAPITITEPAVSDRRKRREPGVLTNRHCEKQVDKRTKIYDRKASGLYVSITKAGAATFYLQVTDRFSGKARCKWLGVYNPATFNIDHARTAVYALKARIGMGENVFETLRQHKALKSKQSLTVDELIEKRVAWMATLEKKADGEMRPRIESWEAVASHLRRLVSPTLGKKIAAEVTRSDVAELSNDILDGKLGVASVSNARHMRRATSGMYNWAAEAGRDYIPATFQPCLRLPKLPKEHARERVLSADEIKTLWYGLDDTDMAHLAIKFALATMLRSGELLPLRRDEVIGLDGPEPVVIIPANRVKKRRKIVQPLSPLAVKIIRKAMSESDATSAYVFQSVSIKDRPRYREAMAVALRGDPKNKGLCETLGLAHFTPHDLRRTAATLAGDLEFNDSWIAACLDHQTGKQTEDKVSSVTGVYQRSKRLGQKRKVLDAVGAELRAIVGEPVRPRRKRGLPPEARSHGND
jgi:integrase